MNIKKLLLITGCFTMMLISLRFVWVYHYSSTNLFQAEEGILDLRDSKLADRPVQLTGEWNFYPWKLQSTSERDNKPRTIHLPTNWEKELKRQTEDSHSNYYYGTYHLRILLNKSTSLDTYSFYMKDIRSASSVFVNGEKVFAQGTVSESQENYMPNVQPYFVTVDSGLQEIDLLIQVADDGQSRASGIKTPIQFGYSKDMRRSYTISILLQSLTASVLLLNFVFSLIIFIGFSKRLEMMYLAIVFLSASTSILLDDDRILLIAFPTISNSVWQHVFPISYVTSVIFLMLVFKRLLKKSIVQNKVLTVTNYAGILLYFFYLLFHFLGLRSESQLIFSTLMITIPIVISISLFILVKRGTAGVIYLLLALISIAHSIGWASLKSNNILILPYYPFDIIFAVLLFTIFWFKQFFEVTEESQALASRLHRLNEQKDEFLANTSHELRNPLHGIMNISETIYQEEGQLSTENKKNMETLIMVSKRMSYILNDLWDTQRLKEDGLQLQVEEVDITAVATSAVDALKFMTEGKDLTFKVVFPDHFSTVLGDETRLFQIMFNLIHNAIKFTDSGEILITGQERGKQAVISVQDTGNGIEPDFLKSIFQPYEQEDSSITSIGGGLGLGLNICQKLVRLHGGDISVQSKVHEGSVFTFTLPLGQSNVISVKRTSAKTVHEEEVLREEGSLVEVEDGASILIVDDDVVNGSVIKQILQASGFIVTTCTSGAEALALVEQRKWNLVISDVMMPKMSGYQLAERIREKFTIAQLPILLLTARSEAEHIHMGFHFGANDYLTKPVDRLELVARVRVITDLQQSMTERTAMEAAWLQAQIQPHFLFNTLNAIVALSEEDPEKMLKLIVQFGTYLNSSFSVQNAHQLVPLKDELKLVESFVYIQQERFGDRVTVEWEIEVDKEIMVPPLAIQTLVENAINHGVLSLPEGGNVTISIVKQETHVEISIIDNGVGMSQQEIQDLMNGDNPQRGIGLQNTNKRLTQLFGAGLNITSEQGIGTIVSFDIPIKE